MRTKNEAKLFQFLQVTALLAACGFAFWPQGDVYAFGKARKKPYLMAVLGDSISAGSLADVPIPLEGTPEERVRKWADQRVDSNRVITNKHTYSWASGTKIRSQYRLLGSWLRKNEPGRALEVLNMAWPGDQAVDLAPQVERVVETMESGRYESLYYVTLLIGANDACGSKSGTPIPKMRVQLLAALARLASIRQNDPIRVLVVGIPRIPDLGEDAIRNHITLFGLSCKTVRNNILKFCNPRLLWNNWDEYGDSMQIVENVNRLLQSVATEARAQFPNLDLRYTSRLYHLSIPIDIMAADCFHPGKKGQEQLSLEVWKDQPWFN